MRFTILLTALLVTACAGTPPGNAEPGGASASAQTEGLRYDAANKRFRSNRTGRVWPPRTQPAGR